MTEELVRHIPRFHTALAEWAACLILVLFLNKRFKGWKLILIILISFAVQTLWQITAGMLPLACWVPGMIFAVLLMAAFIYAACDVTPLAAFYWCVHAFIMAEFAASFEWQISFYLTSYIKMSPLVQKIVEYVIMVVLYFVVFAVNYLLESRYMKNRTILDVRPRDLLTVFGIAVTVFTISNLSFVTKNTPFSGRYAVEIFYIRTLVDLVGLVLLYSQREQKLWMHAKTELSALQNVLNRHYEQYRQSKETIEMINRTYHDLKHQIAVIRAEQNPEKRAAYLDELESGIKYYEAQNKTGNAVLDVILTSKSITCIDNKIHFSCVADGKLLDFMDVLDICSIFGNALENAIEGVKNIKDPERRLIKLVVYSKNDLLIINFGNYYESKLKFENGNLVTTKKDQNLHGYGIKSIKMAVAKYGGTVNIDTKDNWFNLSILIPLPKNQKDQESENEGENIGDN
ncbi:MAG TPA: ATP-binding protein [Clostridia bacterium]